MSESQQVLLRAAGVALILDLAGPHLPRVLHWGGDPTPWQATPGIVPDLPLATLDGPLTLTLLPGQPEGWSGSPGLAGHREGGDLFPRFTLTAPPALHTEPGGAQQLIADAADLEAGVSVTCELRLEPSGVVRLRHTVTNLGTGVNGSGVYTVDGVTALLPVPAEAEELLDLTGRWCRERSPQRAPFTHGTHARFSRRGRTGHDATLLMIAGTPGFSFRRGEVWATHVAWSGNHTHLAEKLPEGAGDGGSAVVGGAELLLPGEIRLSTGQTYTTPWVCFAWSDQGLDGVTARLHGMVRARPNHPTRPRPMVLNTWEAVYFDHDIDRLTALAEQAAAIGVERYVLDDGWFRGRRDDSAGLGDWFVDDEVWPKGLRPLADRVRSLGMEFGLWVEPEMVNPDSDLAREHPDWLLAAPGRWPLPWRRQMIVDVANPQAYHYLLERLSSLIDEIGIGYLKWDHNRDLHEAVHAAGGAANGVYRAGVHVQTVAVYRLLDELRARHPGLEIESCSSGGARVDLEILEHTDRIWASDTNDALERQSIQRWTGLLVPPELVGSHVGPPVSHTTGRTVDLAFRCATSLFGHAGIEWDITSCSPAESAQLTDWIALYKELRHLLHTGDVVRLDHPDAGAWLHGVVSADLSEAVFCYARLTTSADGAPGRLRFAGLDPALCYQVTQREPVTGDSSVVVSGAVLQRVGLPAPLLHPAQAIVLHLRAAAGAEPPDENSAE